MATRSSTDGHTVVHGWPHGSHGRFLLLWCHRVFMRWSRCLKLENTAPSVIVMGFHSDGHTEIPTVQGGQTTENLDTAPVRHVGTDRDCGGRDRCASSHRIRMFVAGTRLGVSSSCCGSVRSPDGHEPRAPGRPTPDGPRSFPTATSTDGLRFSLQAVHGWREFRTGRRRCTTVTSKMAASGRLLQVVYG